MNAVAETDGTHFGRAYIEHLQKYKSNDIQELLNRKAAPGVVIKTDGHVAYPFLNEKYQHKAMKMPDPIDNDMHLAKEHIVIGNLKNWLRGTFKRLPNKHAQ